MILSDFRPGTKPDIKRTVEQNTVRPKTKCRYFDEPIDQTALCIFTETSLIKEVFIRKSIPNIILKYKSRIF